MNSLVGASLVVILSGCASHSAKKIAEKQQSQQEKKMESLLTEGRSALKQEKWKKAQEFLTQCHRSFLSLKQPVSESYLIAGRCLKKLGWNERRKKNYFKAYAYHGLRYQYAQQTDSAQDIHDALISLDVDAYYMGNKTLSKIHLLESLKVAESIYQEKEKLKAFGTSFNNLAGTLAELGDFKKARYSALEALSQWSDYSKHVPSERSRVVWAHFTVGDVYEKWSKSKLEKTSKRSRMKHKACKSYLSAQKLGKEIGMNQKQTGSIEKKVKELCD